MKEINFEHIDLYLKNQLKGKELEDFKQSMESNPEFAKSVENQKLAQESIKIAGKSKLKAQLSAIHQEVIVRKSFWKSKIFRNVAIASLVILGGTAVLLLNKKPNETVVEKNYSIENKTKEEQVIVDNSLDSGNDQQSNKTSNDANYESTESKIGNEPHSLIENKSPKNQNEINSENNDDVKNPNNHAESFEKNEPQNTNPEKEGSNKERKGFRNSNPNANFESNKTKGCTPLTISFTEKTTIDNGEINQYYWDFGDGNSSISPNPTHTYEKSGIYTVRLKVWAKDGSVDEIVKKNLIHSHIVPKAKFEAVPKTVIVNTNVIFDDRSSQLSAQTKYQWDFGDDLGYSSEKSPSYVYRQTGDYEVSLKLTNEYGCRDEAYRTVAVINDIKVFVPNSFSPNGDGQNDTFKLSATGISSFYLGISNRKGELVYQSDDYKTHGWDGKIRGKNPDIIPQVFVYVLKVKGLNGREFEKKGTITIIK
jgi:gliding motility-associated-like protein